MWISSVGDCQILFEYVIVSLPRRHAAILLLKYIDYLSWKYIVCGNISAILLALIGVSPSENVSSDYRSSAIIDLILQRYNVELSHSYLDIIVELLFVGRNTTPLYLVLTWNTCASTSYPLEYDVVLRIDPLSIDSVPVRLRRSEEFRGYADQVWALIHFWPISQRLIIDRVFDGCVLPRK